MQGDGNKNALKYLCCPMNTVSY